MKRYRAIERYSARRLPTASLPSSSDYDRSSPRLKQANQIICQAASFYFSRFQKSILRSDLNLIGTLRLWLTNLAFAAYVTLYSVPLHLFTGGIRSIYYHISIKEKFRVELINNYL
jgi:hypothetical protein